MVTRVDLGALAGVDVVMFAEVDVVTVTKVDLVTIVMLASSDENIAIITEVGMVFVGK